MIVKLILPDDEPNIIIRSLKLKDDGVTTESMHSFVGTVLKDWVTIDLTSNKEGKGDKTPGD